MLQHIVVFAVLVSKTEALQCASCTNITQGQACQKYVNCNQGERCYATSFGVGQDALIDLGCKTETACLSLSASSAIIGRRSMSSVHCSQCCAVDRCNSQLCSSGTQVTSEVGQCADDPQYDCQKFSSLFNICVDTVHAKTACRKWCGLCNLVDGSWSTWTSWSSCSVTCGKSHVTRSRSCTDPSPAHGGLQCTGNSTDTNTCTLDLCPIHGGWSSWKSWGSCSKSCGIGTQSRQRACDNPSPALAGNHCFGDDNDFHACFVRSCTDGHWSTWSQWSSCTGGLKFRNRTCDSPPPSQFGKVCVGDSTKVARCSPVAFTVNFSGGIYSTSTSTLIFKTVVTNIGGGYNTSTGKFTCTFPGLYSFTLTLQIGRNTDVYCYIRKNNNDITFAQTHGLTGTLTPASVSVYLSLSVGDVVYVGDCVSYQSIYKGIASVFSGALT